MNPIERGEQARAILSDPLVSEALETLEAKYRNSWAASDTADTEHRERMYALVRALKDFRSHFENLVITGELSKKDQRSIDGRKGFFG